MREASSAAFSWRSSISSVLFQFCEGGVKVRCIVVFLPRRRMAAPLAFDFRAQLEHVRKSIKIQASIFLVSAGTRHAEDVGFRGDVRREMRLLHQQRDDLIAVTGFHQPPLCFDERRVYAYERIAFLWVSFALRPIAGGLIGTYQILHGAETDQAAALGEN